MGSACRAFFSFQNINFKLQLLSFTRSALLTPSVYPSLLWLWSGACHSWHCSLTSVSLWSGCSTSPFPLCYFPCFLFIYFPWSDESRAVGSTRGWEIPTANSHCMTMCYDTPGLRLPVQNGNRDRLDTLGQPNTKHWILLHSLFMVGMLRLYAMCFHLYGGSRGRHRARIAGQDAQRDI